MIGVLKKLEIDEQSQSAHSVRQLPGVKGPLESIERAKNLHSAAQSDGWLSGAGRMLAAR